MIFKTAILDYIVLTGYAVGLAMILYGQFKYNKGIFLIHPHGSGIKAVPFNFRMRPFFPTPAQSRAPAGLSRAGDARPPPTGRFSEQMCKIEKRGLTFFCLPAILANVPPREHTARGYSSAGRALDWQSRGQRFDPAYLHQNDTTFRRVVFLFVILKLHAKSARRRFLYLRRALYFS